MPFFEKERNIFFFSHIPKTGGSSIDYYLMANGYEMTFHSDHIKPCSLQHRHNSDPELLEAIKERNITYSFTIMRNPLDRIVSEFFMGRTAHEEIKLKDFKEFVIKIFNLYDKDAFVSDNHIRPQSEFIHKNMDIYKFNNLERLMNNLKKYDAGFENINLPHINKSTTSYNSLMFIKNKLNWYPDEDVIEAIEDFYESDLKIYNTIT